MAGRLIVGPGFALCRDCVTAAQAALHQRDRVPRTRRVNLDEEEVELPPCPFCGCSDDANRTLIDFGRGRACNVCLALAAEILAQATRP